MTDSEQIKEKIDKLIPIFANASIGDFSKDVPDISEEDEFSEVYAGIQVMLDVIRDKVGSLEKEIDTRKKIEIALENKEERFRALIENSSDAISLTDTTGKIMYVSPSFSKILGFTPEEAIGKSGLELIHPDDVKRATDVTSQIVGKLGQSVVIELRTKHKDGTWRSIEITSTNQLDNPNINAIVSNFHDVTERTIIQETLAKEKAEDEAILANIGDGLIVTDKEGKIEMMNYVAENLLGWRTEEVTGKNLSDVLAIDDEHMEPIGASARPIVRALTTGEKVTGNFYYKRKDETKFPAAIIITPLRISGRVAGSIEIFRDITHEKELNRAKDEFISLASHELRTPMTAIKGLISMILHGSYGPVNDELKKPLENIRLSSERQVHLINDLLDVSRLQTGKINYRLTNFSPKQVINESIESLQPLAQQRGITLQCTVDENNVQADSDWVKQVINNLVGNALKFTEKGTITVTTRSEKEFVFVVVTDTGIGIDSADKDKLFERFRQLGKPFGNATTGSGLGLYIAREVVRKMGGDLVLEKSELGKGSTFSFSLPKAESPHAKKVKEQIQKEVQIAFHK